MMDVVDQYDPDFIYTDGTVQGPFTGDGTGTGIKADAMPVVMADFYNRTLQRRGEVDTFSIVKFRRKTNGTVNTEEHGVPPTSTPISRGLRKRPWAIGFTRPGSPTIPA
jgi:alpha-L-fucosidase